MDRERVKEREREREREEGRGGERRGEEGRKRRKFFLIFFNCHFS